MNAYDIIGRPIMTEKSYEGIPQKRYTFEVDIHSTKTQVKIALETIYSGIKIAKVNTMVCRGKLKRQGKNSGYTPNFKKAIVQLEATSKPIDSFES